jgi:hypothetical protein
MHLCMTRIAQRYQVKFGIVTCLTAEYLMVNV